MIVDIINEIKEKEEQASKLVQEAKIQARDIIKGVETAMAEQERNAVQENRTMLNNMLESTRKDFKLTIDEMLKQKRAEEIDKLSQCKKNLANTADYIVERVMSHGNS